MRNYPITKPEKDIIVENYTPKSLIKIIAKFLSITLANQIQCWTKILKHSNQLVLIPGTQRLV